MRSIFLVFISVLLVVLSAGYTIIWFLQAGNVRRSVEAQVAEWNQQGVRITYESFEVNGYPLQLRLSFSKPNIAFSVPNAKGGVGIAHELKSLGRVEASANALSTQFRLSSFGPWELSSGEGEAQLYARTEPSGEASCTARLKPSVALFSSLWNLPIGKGEPAQWVEHVREIDCVQPAQSLLDKAQLPLVTSGPGRMFFSREEAAASSKYRIYVKSSDVEFSAASDRWIDQYMASLGVEKQPFALAAFGKQQAELDIVAQGAFAQGLAALNSPASLQIVTFTVSNRLSSAKITGYFSATPTATGRDVGADLSFDASVTPEYDALLQGQLEAMVNGWYAPEALQKPPFVGTLTRDQALFALQGMAPSISPLGQMRGAFKASASLNQAMQPVSAKIDALSFSATPYRFDASGTFSQPPKQIFPDATASVSCHECSALISDALYYAQRLIEANTLMSGSPAPSPLSEKLISQIVRFAAAIGTTDASGNTVYALQSQANSGVTINGKTLGELTQRWAESAR